MSTVLSMCAQALLAVAAVGQPRPCPRRPAASLARYREPARRESDQSPGDDPGLVKASVTEARRLARLATAHDRRRPRSRPRRVTMAPPPARGRWHHYHA